MPDAGVRSSRHAAVRMMHGNVLEKKPVRSSSLQNCFRNRQRPSRHPRLYASGPTFPACADINPLSSSKVDTLESKVKRSLHSIQF